jgi:peptide-methionine (S)-S-oxide reductase
VGTQYRSAIFYHNQTQQAIAEETIRNVAALGLWRNPIVTEVVPLQIFYPAEEYHQGYFRSHPTQAYCRAVIEPKVSKARNLYLAKMR